ncbi:MAG TPA: hypothetical protein VK814_01690 [Acidobacteriaceae bacterium]|jgi:hypothetical protein|nr:hypothetical protein [Acidobacteriaceae bacterium]
MSAWLVHPTTTITAFDHRSLRAVWKRYRHTGLVGSYVVEKPLTDAQLRRLPMELRDRLTNGEPPCTSVVELERIFELPDTRTDAGD